MRKSLPLLILLVAVSAVAASLSLQRLLSDAVKGERLAATRYDAFATQADTEGYAGVACLFRAQAKAERIHEARFIKLMTDRSMPVPTDATPPVNVLSTQRNLEVAISAEQAERDGTYLYAISACNDCNDVAAAKVFDTTRDTETEHANLCANALKTMSSMKNRQAFYVCPICGYTTDVRLPFCPSCQRKEALERVN